MYDPPQPVKPGFARVKFRERCFDKENFGHYQPGDVVDLAEAVARDLVERKVAVAV